MGWLWNSRVQSKATKPSTLLQAARHTFCRLHLDDPAQRASHPQRSSRIHSSRDSDTRMDCFKLDKQRPSHHDQILDIHTTFSPGNDTFAPAIQFAPDGISKPAFCSRSHLRYVPTLRTYLHYEGSYSISFVLFCGSGAEAPI